MNEWANGECGAVELENNVGVALGSQVECGLTVRAPKGRAALEGRCSKQTHFSPWWMLPMLKRPRTVHTTCLFMASLFPYAVLLFSVVLVCSIYCLQYLFIVGLLSMKAEILFWSQSQCPVVPVNQLVFSKCWLSRWESRGVQAWSGMPPEVGTASSTWQILGNMSSCGVSYLFQEWNVLG